MQTKAFVSTGKFYLPRNKIVSREEMTQLSLKIYFVLLVSPPTTKWQALTHWKSLWGASQSNWPNLSLWQVIDTFVAAIKPGLQTR